MLSPQKLNAPITAECTRRQWLDPEVRQKMIEGLSKSSRRRWDDPLYHALHSEQTRSLCAKFTLKQKRMIARRYRPRCAIDGARALAREFGVHHKTILRIVSQERDLS